MLLRGLLGSVLVLLGGLVGAALPGSSPVASLDPLATLRDSEWGRMAGLLVVMVGLGLLASQWLRLCRRASAAADEPDGDSDGGVALVRGAVVVWSLPLLLAPPLFSRDGWSYAAQGVLERMGVSPYESGPGVLHGPVVEAVDPRWLDTPAPYGPLPLWWGSLVAEVTGDPWLLVVGHRLLALVGLVLLAWAVPRLARWGGVDPGLASAVALASPFVLANGVAGLHNDLLMVGLSAAALVVAAERGWVAGAVVAGTAAAVKAPGGLVAVAVVLVSLPVAATLLHRVRRVAAVGAVAGGTLVALGVLTGVGSGWVTALGVPGSLTTPLSVTALLDEALGGTVVRTAGTVLALVVAAVATLWRPSGDGASAVVSVATVMTAAVVLSPVVHLWYLLWALPFLAAARLPATARAAVMVVSVGFGVAAPLDSSLHGAYLAILLGVTVLVGQLLVLLVTRRARDRVARIVAGAAPRRGDGAGYPALRPTEPSGPAEPDACSSSIRPTLRSQE